MSPNYQVNFKDTDANFAECWTIRHGVLPGPHMIAMALAFAAGVLTVAAPCVLPMLPIVLGGSLGATSRWRPLAIVGGFVTAFAAVTVVFSVFSHALGLSGDGLRYAAMAGLLIFGSLMVWRAPFEAFSIWATGLLQRKSTDAGQLRTAQPGVWSGFLLGLSLGAVWTPCAGPVLGSILTLLATAPNPQAAAAQLLFYAVGAGLPMLAIAYGGRYAGAKVRLVARHLPALQRGFGVLIVGLAIAMFFQYDVLLAAWLTSLFPSLPQGL